MAMSPNQVEAEMREQIEDLKRQLEEARVQKINEQNAAEAARTFRTNYNAFVEVGFTEKQAYEILIETLRMNRR